MEDREQILKQLKALFEKTKTKDVLNKVLAIEQKAKNIDQGNTDSNARNEEDRDTVIHLCSLLLHGYLPSKVEAALLTDLLNVTDLKKYPKSVQPIAFEIKGYLEKMGARLERIENVINELDNKLKGLEEKEFKISETEKIAMKMMTHDVEKELKIFKNYQKGAEEAINRLNSKTNSYYESRKVTDWIVTGCLSLASFAVGGIIGGVLTSAVYVGGGSAAVGSGLFVGAFFRGSRQVWLYTLLFGAAVSIPLVYLVLKRWFAERQFRIELLSIHRKYRDIITESQSSFNNVLRKENQV